MTTTYPHATVHGRFQPFHLGHLHYLRLALARCEELTVGITNPDRAAMSGSSAEAHRHDVASNPFSFWERSRMIRESLLDDGVDPSRFCIVPLDINHMDSTDWAAYMPSDAVWLTRVKGEWGEQKIARFEGLGLTVVRLPFEEWTDLTATRVREAIRSEGAWRALVPRGTARILEEIDAERRLAEISAALE